MRRSEKPIVTTLLGVLLLSSLSCNLLGSQPGDPQGSATSAAEVSRTAKDNPATAIPAETTVSASPPEPTALHPTSTSLKVAYPNEGNIFLWTQGVVSQLTKAGDAHNPMISPDGEMIAFLKTTDEFHLEIWAVNTDKTNERRLVSVADMDKIGGGVRDPSAVAINPYHFEWQTDSQRLAFNSHQIFMGPGLTLLNDLNFVNVDTQEIQNTFLSGWGGEFAFSPDGNQIAITQPDQIILTNTDGSNYRIGLTYDPVITYSEYRYVADPKWASRSDYLYVALPPVDPLASPNQPTELWRIPTDGSNPIQIGRLTAVPFFEQPVVFSPDFERIAFVKETGQPEENRRELFLASSDGTGEWLYATGSPISFLGWSPDGNHFAYSSGIDSQTWIGSPSEVPRSLGQEFTDVHSLTWVSDNQFLFWRTGENAFEIFLGSLEGSSVLLDRTFGDPPFLSFTE